MQKLRVLVLDDVVGINKVVLGHEGFTLEVTSLKDEGIADAYGYKVCDRGLALAREGASFDFIVIGNNQGSGRVYAREIPAEMRRKTLIVWNDYRPGDEWHYALLGYECFATRKNQTDWLIRMTRETIAAQPLH